MKDSGKGLEVAEVDPALCFGCGACVSICPTGAIVQPLQSELGLKAVLSADLASAVNRGLR
jgi:ferredoxin